MSGENRLTVFAEVSDGVQTVYPIRFALGYIKKADVYVYQGEHGNYEQQLVWRWVDDNNIELDYPLPAGETFWVRRIVQRLDLDNYFETAALNPRSIDDTHLQLLMLSQEIMDGFGDLDGKGNIKNDLDMRGYKILGLAEANTPEGAVTKGQLDVEVAKVEEVQETLDKVLEEKLPSGYRGEWTPEANVTAGDIWSYKDSEWRSKTGVSIEPSDGKDWRKSVSATDLIIVREDLLGVDTKLYMGADGVSVKVGNAVPLGTTHLRTDIAGGHAIVKMAQIASGNVTEINDTSATIGGVITNLIICQPNASSWNVKEWGVLASNSVEVNTTRLNEAINEARSQGVTALTIDDKITVTDTLDRKGSIAFIGNGEVTGLYRKNVAKLTAPTGAFFQDVEPSEHLKRFSTKSNPVVVIVGDSIATEIADVNGKTASIWSLLQEKITSDNPSKNITFHNRAIGGQTYFTAVGLPVGGTLPDWYSDTNKAWPLYVGELEPDLLIFHFGMNDGDGSFQSSTVRKYVDSLLPNASIFTGGIPDVVYCTNLTPAIDAQISGFGDEAGQSGRDFVAGYTRTFAKNRGYGLIDVHRNCCIVKDGFDPLSTSLERIGDVVPTAGAVVASESCRDFKWNLTVSQLSVAEPLAVKLGGSEVTDNTNRGSFAVISESGGYFVVDLYSTVTDFYHSTTTTTLVPAGSFSLGVEKKGSTLNIAVDGTTVFNYEKLVTHGSEFVPRAGDSTYQTGNITAATFFRGVATVYKTQIANDEMWGVSTANVLTKTPWGGNGVNHPSSIGVSMVMQPVVAMSEFGSEGNVVLDTFNITRFSNGFSQLSGFGRVRVSKSGNMVVIEGDVSQASDNTTGVIFNIPARFRVNRPNGMFMSCVYQSGAAGLLQILPNGDVSVVKGGLGFLSLGKTYTL